MADNYVL